MKKIIFILALLALPAAWLAVRIDSAVRAESERRAHNESVLRDSIVHYRTRLNAEAASVEALRLKCREFERLRAEDARRIRDLGLRLQRIETISKTSVATGVEVCTEVLNEPDSVSGDTLRRFSWSDCWVTVEGSICGDTARCRVTSTDTILQTVHRVPRKFLFIRYGTKAIRQEIVSTNPHTRIVSAEYIELPKRRRRRDR